MLSLLQSCNIIDLGKYIQHHKLGIRILDLKRIECNVPEIKYDIRKWIVYQTNQSVASHFDFNFDLNQNNLTGQFYILV